MKRQSLKDLNLRMCIDRILSCIVNKPLQYALFALFENLVEAPDRVHAPVLGAIVLGRVVRRQVFVEFVREEVEERGKVVLFAMLHDPLQKILGGHHRVVELLHEVRPLRMVVGE